MFDEQPDGDPHGECAAEIHRLQAINAELLAASEQGAAALADVLATYQHAEPEALKAALVHANRVAHAAYDALYRAIQKATGSPS